MKRNKLGAFFIFLSLVLALTSGSSISNLAVRYKCLSSSGLVIDDYTGKPIVGAAVQVLGSISLPRFPEGHEVRSVYLVTVLTDTNGIFTIPACTNEVAKDWDYYEQTLISKPGNPPRINPDDFKGDVPPPHGFVIRTVTLRQEPIARDELFEQETNITSIGSKPTSSLWPPDSGSISVGYLYFPKDQDTHEVEQFLKNLVQDK